MGRLKWALILLISNLFSICALAQVDIGAGLQTGYPYLFNSLDRSGYRQSSLIGLYAGVAYKFGDSYFYPSLSVSTSSLSLPIARIDGFVWSDEFTKQDIMLNLKHKSMLNNAEINWYAGIGVAFVSADLSSASSVNGNYAGSVTDSGSYESASAAADIGLEGKFRFSQSNPHWWWGVNANLQAVYITGEYGHSYISSGYTVTKTNINGTLLCATLNLCIIYRIGKAAE